MSYITEEKASPFTMSQCFIVAKAKFQHSVTTALFFKDFSAKALSLGLLGKNLIKLKIFVIFFFDANDELEQRINLKIFDRVEKIPTEAISCFKEDMVMARCLELGFLKDTKESKMEKKMRRMIVEVGSHPHVKQMKMLSG